MGKTRDSSDEFVDADDTRNDAVVKVKGSKRVSSTNHGEDKNTEKENEDGFVQAEDATYNSDDEETKDTKTRYIKDKINKKDKDDDETVDDDGNEEEAKDKSECAESIDEYQLLPKRVFKKSVYFSDEEDDDDEDDEDVKEDGEDTENEDEEDDGEEEEEEGDEEDEEEDEEEEEEEEDEEDEEEEEDEQDEE